MNKNLKNPHDFGRHGEVILKPVSEIPSNAKLIGEGSELIVGHSESGHHHVLKIPKEEGVTIKMYELDGKVYLDLPRNGELIHQKSTEKHDTQVFTPKKYIREVRQSYSYAQKMMRRVID